MITVVGSINLDIVATGPALPRPGETVGGARLARHPGGKGANQALAARRLGADVQLYAHGEIIPWDHNGSMTPAVAFTLTVHNPAATAVDASLLLSMPLAAQPNTARVTDKATPDSSAKTPLACKAVCDAAVRCNAWSFAAATGQINASFAPF